MYRKFFSLIGLAVMLTSVAVAQQAGYPAPTYPELKLKQDYSAEELLAIARVVVRKPSLGPNPGDYQERDASNLINVGYNIQSGEKVLLTVNSRFDKDILEAFVTAIKEAGGRLDVLITHAGPMGPVRDGAESARRLLMREAAPPRGFAPTNVMQIAEMGNYQILISGGGGRRPINIPYRWEFIPWNTMDKFVTGMAEYPYELLEAIDQKVWDTMLRAKRVRVTDPEGTDISWTVSQEGYEEAGARKRFGIAIRGHVGLWPNNYFPEAQPPDANGVIAGTLNGSGTFPPIKVFLEDHSLYKIEGGGAYAEFWKSLIDKYKDVQWPLHPGPGMTWLREAAIGTCFRQQLATEHR